MGSTAAVRRARSTIAMERAAVEVRGVELVEEDPGRFEREFVGGGDALLGRGTFGQVFRVRAKYGGPVEKMYAVKKSKVYEGDRHRLVRASVAPVDFQLTWLSLNLGHDYSRKWKSSVTSRFPTVN